jgi:chemotaxis protein MotB
MKGKLIIVAVMLASVLVSSCVSTKKYDAAVNESNQLKKQNEDLKNQNTACNKQLADLNTSQSAYRSECEAAKARLEAVQRILKEEQKTMDIVEKRLLDALVNFNNNGLEVYHKNGLIYVSMEDALMYKSGSAALGDNAKKALGSLSNVLNDYPKLKVTIQGNTDDVLYKKGSDNWTLSTERANNVIRVLRDDFKVDPARLTAAGKGRYAPVADNATAEGRAKNRRTEIILNPDIDRIWKEAEASK